MSRFESIVACKMKSSCISLASEGFKWLGLKVGASYQCSVKKRFLFFPVFWNRVVGFSLASIPKLVLCRCDLLLIFSATWCDESATIVSFALANMSYYLCIYVIITNTHQYIRWTRVEDESLLCYLEVVPHYTLAITLVATFNFGHALCVILARSM